MTTSLPLGYEIRPAIAADVPVLPDIERRAAARFKALYSELGLTDEILQHSRSIEQLEAARKAGCLWVAAAHGEAVGFALAFVLAGYAHLEELDVLPEHGRHGLGAGLLEAVCTWAQRAGYPAVTLRTFEDVPWNGPFYARHGFRVVDSATLSAQHAELEALERRSGLQTDLRVTMVRWCAGGEEPPPAASIR